jgi:hypothetical protein
VTSARKLGFVVCVPLGERRLRVAISEFVEHDHVERSHRGSTTGCLLRSQRRRTRISIRLHQSRDVNDSAAS